MTWTVSQEQYLSEGSALGSWDNSMKSVLCFGEDYSNYIRCNTTSDSLTVQPCDVCRRRSELPSLDHSSLSANICGLQVGERNSAADIDGLFAVPREH